MGTDQSGWIALFTTRDLGRHWRERLLPGAFLPGWPTAALGLGARGDLQWLYSGDQILLSRNAGRTWHEISLATPLSASIVSLSFSDARHGLLVTQSPLTGTSTWLTDDGGSTFRLEP